MTQANDNFASAVQKAREQIEQKQYLEAIENLDNIIQKKAKRLNYRGEKLYNLMKMLDLTSKNQNENRNLRHNPKFLHQI